MEIYTIINTYSLSDYGNLDECFVAHFVNREDAEKAYKTMLSERGQEIADTESFETLVTTGAGVELRKNGDVERIFVRCEPVQTEFSFVAVTVL